LCPGCGDGALWRGNFHASRERTLAGFVLGIGIVFPVAYAIVIKAVLFDGMRHFIFILPLIAVAAAVAADRGLDWLSRFPYRQPVWGVLALYGCAHISIYGHAAPDQYVYYNAFVGGSRAPSTNSSSIIGPIPYAEAVRVSRTICAPTYGADFEEHEFTVAVCGPPISAGYYFPPNFRFVRDRARADFLLPSRRITRTIIARPVDLSGREEWVRSCLWCWIGAISSRSNGPRAGIGGAPFEADRWIAAVVEICPVALK